MLSKITRQRLLASTTIASFAAIGFAGVAAAQTTPAPDAAQEVVVTGSRIARQNFDSPTPVSVVDTRTIEATGNINTGDIIRQLPQAGVSGITPTTSNFSTTGAGISTVELRNLGESRTLVLLNGRRFVPGLPGTQIVDFNDIPPDIIDHIDVITGGASSVYGSDALAGVVNIITKKHYQGVTATVQYGESERNDDISKKFSVTAGSDFADGKGNAIVNFTLDSLGIIRAANRADRGMNLDGVNGDDAPSNGAGGPDTSYRTTIYGGFSSYTPQGTILNPRTTTPTSYSYQPNGTILPYLGSRDGFNREGQRELQTPVDRRSFHTQFNYEINPAAQMFAEVTFVNTTASNLIEPTPLANGAGGIYGANPSCTGTGAATVCINGVPLTNPTVPTAVRQLIESLHPGALDQNLVVGVNRRLTEIGPRGEDEDRYTFRSVVGLRGDLGGSWNYEASLNYGRTEETQHTNGEVNLQSVRNALSVTTIGGQTVCADANARTAGCVPLNLFGAGSITPAAAKYITSSSGRTDALTELVGSAFVRGTPFSLPAGPVDVVFGTEYRSERSSDIPDPLTQLGLTSGNKTPPSVGGFDVYELYTEVNVPLLANLPFVKHLDAHASARYSDYSTAGNTNSYAYSLEYQPFNDLKFRAQFSRAVRAPNISELFGGASQTFPQVVDPCQGVTKTAGGQAAFYNVRSDPAYNQANIFNSGVNGASVGNAVAVSCLQDPLVAARVARDGGLAYTQSEKQGTTGFGGGNANLKPESAKTYTIGLVYNPRSLGKWFSPLSLSVDFFNIKINNVITSIAEQTSATNCYNSAFTTTSAFCSEVVRYGAGPDVGAIYAVNTSLQNLGVLTTSGIDVGASYRLHLADLPYMGGFHTDLGSVFLGLQYTYTGEYKLDTGIYSPNQFTGVLEQQSSISTGTVGIARDKAQVNLVYTRKALQISVTTNIIGTSQLSFGDDNQVFTTDGTATGTVCNPKAAGCKHDVADSSVNPQIGPRLFTDAQIRYNITDRASVYFGIDNIFDQYVYIGGTAGDAGQPIGWTTFPQIYDGIGRRYYGGVKVRF